MSRMRPIALWLLLFAAQVRPGSVLGQELEPRAFSPAPVGTKFYFGGVGTLAGGYGLDPGAPISEVRATLRTLTLGGGYTFDLWGHQAQLLALGPYVWGNVSGVAQGIEVGRSLHGFVDPRLRFSFGLHGAPSLSAEDFARTPRKTVVGVSLTAILPFGEYDPERLANLGTHRWAFKPEIGVWHPIGHWTVEGSAGVWFFTPNDDFFPGGATRTQDPLVSLQGHIVYSFQRGDWIAVDGTWYFGGQAEVDGNSSLGRMNNTRIGLTYSLPVGGGHSVKFSYSAGATTRSGANFRTFNVLWQLVTF